MRALVTLNNANSESCHKTIVRNLNRILDIRIIDFDRENGILHFLYNGEIAFEQVKRELFRIGFPIQEYRYGVPSKNQLVVRDTDGVTA